MKDNIFNICELVPCSQLYFVYFEENSHIAENQHFNVQSKLKCQLIKIKSKLKR